MKKNYNNFLLKIKVKLHKAFAKKLNMTVKLQESFAKKQSSLTIPEFAYKDTKMK